MKVEIDYIKKLLQKAQDSERAIFTIRELVDDENEIDEEIFVFHLKILADQYFIVSDFDNSNNIGDSRLSNGALVWTIRNLRLTNKGHDFIDALQNETVWNKLKKEVKSRSLSVIESTAKALLTKIIEQSLNL